MVERKPPGYSNRTMYGALLGGAAGLILAVVVLEAGRWVYQSVMGVDHEQIPTLAWIVLGLLGVAMIPLGMWVGMRVAGRRRNG